MEIAKVDLEKLQLLNDRIQQTIDALQQVRASVHGLASAFSSQSPMAWGASGLSHSGYRPYSPFESAYADAWSQRAYPSAAASNPWAVPQSFGLSHSGFEPSAYKADPRFYGRIAETFPFVAVDPMRAFKPYF